MEGKWGGGTSEEERKDKGVEWLGRKAKGWRIGKGLERAKLFSNSVRNCNFHQAPSPLVSQNTGGGGKWRGGDGGRWRWRREGRKEKKERKRKLKGRMEKRRGNFDKKSMLIYF